MENANEISDINNKKNVTLKRINNNQKQKTLIIIKHFY